MKINKKIIKMRNKNLYKLKKYFKNEIKKKPKKKKRQEKNSYNNLKI